MLCSSGWCVRSTNHCTARVNPSPPSVYWIYTGLKSSRRTVLNNSVSTTLMRNYNNNSTQYDTLTHPLTPSLTQLTHSLSHPLTYSLTHPFAHSLTRSLIHPLTPSLTPSLTHSLTPSLTHSLTHSLTRSLTLTHSLTLSLTHSHSLTHSLARSLTHYFPVELLPTSTFHTYSIYAFTQSCDL